MKAVTPEQRSAKNAYERERRQRAKEDPAYRERVRSAEAKRRANLTEEQRAAKAAYMSEWDKAKRANDPEWRAKSLAVSQARYETHKSEHIANTTAWRKANPERYRAIAKRSKDAHSEERKAYNAAYQAANLDKHRVSAAMRRALVKAAVGSHTAEQWRDVLLTNEGRCAYCDGSKNVGRDHIVPLSRGGSDDIANVVPACHSCNSGKRNYLVEEWFTQ